MAEHQGPEPTGWELMRGLERVQQSVDGLGSRVVSPELFQAHLETDGREKKAIRDDIREIREDLDSKTRRDQDRDDENRRSKSANWVAIAMGFAAIVAAALIPVFTNGGA